MKSNVSVAEVKELIGEEAVQKMLDAFPGKLIYLPKKPLAFTSQKEKEIYITNCFYSAGMSKEEIAAAVGLSVDRISKIIYKRYKNT